MYTKSYVKDKNLASEFSFHCAVCCDVMMVGEVVGKWGGCFSEEERGRMWRLLSGE